MRTVLLHGCSGALGVVAGLVAAIAITSIPVGLDSLQLTNNKPDVYLARIEVEQAIEQFRTAMVERRPDKILAYSASELTFGHSNGVVQSREEFADVVRSGAEVFKRIDITDRHLTISGNTAIERHHFSADIVFEGSLKTFELEVVEVWKKTDRWRLIARQALMT